MQFIQCRAASKCQRFTKDRLLEYLDQGSADDEVLFNLEIFDPGGFTSPRRYVVVRDHASAVSSALMMIFQA